VICPSDLRQKTRSIQGNLIPGHATLSGFSALQRVTIPVRASNIAPITLSLPSLTWCEDRLKFLDPLDADLGILLILLRWLFVASLLRPLPAYCPRGRAEGNAVLAAGHRLLATLLRVLAMLTVFRNWCL